MLNKKIATYELNLIKIPLDEAIFSLSKVSMGVAVSKLSRGLTTTNVKTEAENISQDVILWFLKTKRNAAILEYRAMPLIDLSSEAHKHMRNIVIKKTMSRCIDYWRTFKKRSTEEEFEEFESTAPLAQRHDVVLDDVEEAEDAKKLITEIASLPQRRKQVMLMIQKGYSALQIAEMLGISPSTVRSTVAASVQELTKKYKFGH